MSTAIPSANSDVATNLLVATTPLAGLDSKPRLWCGRTLSVEVQTGADLPQSRDLGQPFAVVGSAAEATVSIADPQAARRHFYLHATDDGIFCLDLAAGESDRESGGHWLAPNEVLVVGETRITVRLNPPLEPPSVDAPRPSLCERDSVTSTPPTVQVSRDGKPLVNRTIARQLTIVGRNPPSTFRIESRSVSSVHCVLAYHHHQLWAIDLASASGTIWREQRRVVSLLGDGDELLVGNYTLTYRAPEDARQATSRVAAPSLSSSSAADGLMSPVTPSSADLSTALAGPPSDSTAIETANASRVAGELSTSCPPLDDLRRAWGTELARLAELRSQLHQELNSASASRRQWDAERVKLSTSRETLDHERAEAETARLRWEKESQQLADSRRQLNDEIEQLAQTRRRWNRQAEGAIASESTSASAESDAVAALQRQWQTQLAEVGALRSQLEDVLRQLRGETIGNVDQQAATSTNDEAAPGTATSTCVPATLPFGKTYFQELKQQLENERTTIVALRARLEAESTQAADAHRHLDAETQLWAESRRSLEAEAERLAFGLAQLQQDRTEVEQVRDRLAAELAEVEKLRESLSAQAAAANAATVATDAANSAPSGNTAKDAVPSMDDDASEPVVSRRLIESNLGFTQETYDPEDSTLPVGAITSEAMKQALAQAALADWQTAESRLARAEAAQQAAGSFTLSRTQAIAALAGMALVCGLLGLAIGAWLKG